MAAFQSLFWGQLKLLEVKNIERKVIVTKINFFLTDLRLKLLKSIALEIDH